MDRASEESELKVELQRTIIKVPLNIPSCTIKKYVLIQLK